MKHPGEAALALFAGGELGVWPRLRVARHVRSCEQCSRAVEEFRELREVTLAQVGEVPPHVNWNALALEMKANIRVGLAAGACVGEEPSRFAPRWRGPAFVLPALLLILAGWLLQTLPPALRHATPAQRAQQQAVSAVPLSDVVLEADSEGVGVESDGHAFALRYRNAQNVLLSVRGENSVRARYVDSETGQVTITHVYAQ